MFGDKLLINKCPYLGYSEYLIEYFSIIGYTQTFIPELITIMKERQKNNNQSKNKNPYPPTTLSSITSSNKDYGIVDNELIITQLYPENPNLILKEANQLEPEKSNVIYSFCFDSNDGKNKLFYTCFGYKFYELYKDSNSDEEYYIPKALCIISQYSFFNTFYLICKNLYNLLINNSCKIPFEILVYNIVNFIPSPINSNLQLNLFWDNKKIELCQLTGYPNIDFDLYELFNLLPLNLILEIYIITFLEQSLLFFSSNLELLNTVMYIFYMFNYPCNDSTYFWHIISVGKNNLTEENKFVGKIMVSLLGVNSAYNESIDTSAFGSYHYIVDLDNKKMFYKESCNISIDEKDEATKLTQAVVYIQNIFKEKISNQNFLKTPLINLKTHLENYLNENLENYTTNPKKTFVNFFKDEIKRLDISKKIIEFFYDCNLTLLTKLYNDNELNTSFDKIVKVKEENLDDSMVNVSGYSDEEKIFFDLFRSTIKYKIYFDNFMQDFEVMEIFKIPFLFSKTFVELKIKDQTKICADNLQYFNIIDNLYKINRQTYTKIINFDDFNKHYIQHLCQYFKKFYITDYDSKIFDKNDNNSNNNIIILAKPNESMINLNKKIINRYIYILQNFYEKHEIAQLFPHLKIKEDRIIRQIDRRRIYQEIKSKLIDMKFVSQLNLLLYSLIYVISLTITFHPVDQMVKYLLEIQHSFNFIDFFMKDYLYTLIKSIYKYYEINKKSKKYPNMTLSNVKMYFSILANNVRQKFIVPNEEMMIILKNFFSDYIFNERKELKDEDKQSDEIKDIKYGDVYKNKDYVLFLKYNFTNKVVYKSKDMIERAMAEYGSYNIVVKTNNRVLSSQIVIKIKDYIYSSRFFSPQKIYKDSENIFEDFFDNYNLDFKALNISRLRELILNLIQYGVELDKNPIPVGFLMNTLYKLRNFEQIYQNDKK